MGNSSGGRSIRLKNGRYYVFSPHPGARSCGHHTHLYTGIQKVQEVQFFFISPLNCDFGIELLVPFGYRETYETLCVVYFKKLRGLNEPFNPFVGPPGGAEAAVPMSVKG